MNTWFRFYADALHNPKVQSLSPKMFKFWVNILCIASSNDGLLPNQNEIAFYLRLKISTISFCINHLIEKKLLIDSDGLRPYNWEKRQYKSDTSKERTKKYRERLKEDCDVTDTVTVTPPEQIQIQNRTDTDLNTIQTTGVVCLQSTSDESKKCTIPFQRIFELYHEILPTGLRAKKLNPKRKEIIRARWRESKAHQDERFWITFFNQVAASPFLTGKTYDQRRGPFVLTFDKILRPSMFTQIIDGYYNRDSQGRPSENLFD
jgi:hypothetical protein